MTVCTAQTMMYLISEIRPTAEKSLSAKSTGAALPYVFVIEDRGLQKKWLDAGRYSGGVRAVMKKAIVIGVMMLNLLLANSAKAGVSLIRNGSFEGDGRIADITAEAPRYWCDVNLPEGKFRGWVDSDWSTHGYGDGNSLTLSSEPFTTFTAGDTATVSQQVYLTDVNEKIIFDVALSGTHTDFPWTSEKFSAILQIDGNDVWDSNDWLPDENGEYTIKVNNINVNDANLHTLSLAMRANKSDTHITQYLVRWDFVRFDTYCGGFGYLPEDLNYDCYVDFLDFAMLAGRWLEQNPAYEYDLFEDGVVDEYDVMVFAGGWMTNSDSNNWGDDNCYEVELPAGDIDDSGEVGLGDVSVLAGDWPGAADCSIRADLNEDGVVDFGDFAVLAGQWRQRSWLYGLN